MKSKGTLLLLILILAAMLASCGGEEPTPVVVVVTPGPTQPVVTRVVTPPPGNASPATEAAPPAATEVTVPPTSPPAAGIEILEATFAHGLTDQMAPVDPGSDFQADETVYLSLKVKGRPKEGTVTARFYWNEDLIAEAGVDLADANSGLIFSVGEDTFVGYTLTHEDPFPLGEGYRVEVFYENQPLGTYTFRIAPPPGAIPSQIKSATLARGADDNYNPIDPTTAFASDETVYLVGRGDLGVNTWIQADWYIGGQLDENGTRSITVDDNYTDVGFTFSYLPEGGWPPGEHFVVLTMNGVEVGRYPFTIVSAGGAAPLDETAFWGAFPEPEDAETVPVVEGFDLGLATAMPEPQLFDWYAAWLRDQGWQQQAPTEAMQSRPHQVWRKGEAEFLIEIQGVDDQGRTIVWFQLTGV